MSRIRGKGNKATELRLIQTFRDNDIIGWRRGSKLPGKPDFVFPKLRVAVFVDGCFWHGCPKHATWPKNRAAFWKAKIEGNRSRDRRVDRALRQRGWVVLRIWEHSLTRKAEALTVRRLQFRLHQDLVNKRDRSDKRPVRVSEAARASPPNR